MDTIISSLGEQYRLNNIKYKDDTIVLFIESTQKSLECPYCHKESSKVHSYQTREIQDLPITDRQTILIVTVRKMKCLYPDCSHKYFSERLLFASRNAKKTDRLVDRILKTSSEVSSVCSSKLLRSEKISIGKSSICNLLKKNALDPG